MSIVKFEDYNIDKLNFEHLPPNSKKKSSQTILFPNYDGGMSPLIQIPNIELNNYGIPSRCDLFKEDWQRHFIKIPLDGDDDYIKSFVVWLKNIDKKMNTPEIKEKIFNKKNAKCCYQPLFKVVLDDEDKIVPNKPPYLKLKMATKYPSNEITTSVFINNPDDTKNLITDITTIDDVAEYIKFKSKVKCVLLPSKCWIMNPITPNGDSLYGLTFKLVKVMVTPPTKYNSFYNSEDVEFIED